MATIPFPSHATPCDVSAGSTQPLWTLPPADIGPGQLAENIETDVCVIGGGLAGLSVAYELCKVGRRVILIEDGIIGSGESSRSTAHLMPALDDRWYNIMSVHGLEKARLVAESQIEAINRIGEIIRDERIDCQFERLPAYLFHGLDKHHKDFTEKYIEKEYKAASEVSWLFKRCSINRSCSHSGY